MAKKFTVAIGDKVAYSVQFLRSIGMSHSDMSRGRGTVTAIQPFGDSNQLVTINWDNPELPNKVLAANLAKVGANTRFCAC